MNPLMEIKGCSFAYEDKENIIEDINFSVSSGDIYTLTTSLSHQPENLRRLSFTARQWANE